MKKLYCLICIAYALVICLPTAKADITMRFWDNGVLVRDTALIESQSGKPITSYDEREALAKAGHLKACTGYTFVGWKFGTPIINEKICADDNAAGVITSISIGTKDIDLYAVYKKDSVCYKKITQTSELTDTTYLIVGYTGSAYYAMRGDNDANVKTTENAYKMAGLMADEVTLCGTDTLYAGDKRIVWKLSGATSGNCKWQNKGTLANYFQLESKPVDRELGDYYTTDYVRNMLTDANDKTMQVVIGNNGAVTMSLSQLLGRTITGTATYANHTLFFAPSILASNDYFGTAKNNIFVASVPNETRAPLIGSSTTVPTSESLSGSQISKGTIYLFKATTERRYKCKCGPYSVHFEACGDNSCGSDFSMSRLVKPEEQQTVGCHGLLQFTGVDTTNVRPIIGCPRRWTFVGWDSVPCPDGSTSAPNFIKRNPYPLYHQNDTLFAVYRHKTRGVADYWSSYPDCLQYTVTFDPVNGVVSGTNPATEETAGEGVTVPSASFTTCNDWSFEGWAATPCRGADSNPGGLTKTGTYYPAMDGETLYAVYKNGSYWTSYPWCTPATITLDAGTGTVGGNTTMPASEASANSGITLLTDAVFNSCVGWTFAGWSETQITANTTLKPTMYVHNALYRPKTASSDVLYAVYRRAIGASDSLWTSLPGCDAYHIVLHACGTDDCSASKIDDEHPNTKTIPETSLGEGAELPVAIPLCERWVFVGWHKGNPIEHKYTEPTDLYAAGFRYIPSVDNEALYAVYGHNTNTPGVYDYWTSNPDCTPYSVILHTCEGTLSGVTELDTMETVVGQGIELPAAIPLCDARGWNFYGWVEGGELSTTTDVSSLHIYSAGEHYKPIRDNMHLYAIYSVTGYKQVTSASELNTSSDYVIAFYWNYGNAYPYEDFALSNVQHASPYQSYLSLTPMSAYIDEHGDKYVANPGDNCIWQLEQSSAKWFVKHKLSGKYLTSTTSSTSTGNPGSQYTIDIANHRMSQDISSWFSTTTYYLHFENVNLQTFYLYLYNTADKCYLYRKTGTVYASWPHCAEYTVYFDGCDGIADVEGRKIKEEEAGKGVVMPGVTDYCSTPAQGGWQFAGWATSPELDRTDNLAQHLYPVGTTYIPTKDNITLYAVYYIPTNDFELVSSQSDLYFGRNYIVVNSGQNRAMGNTHYNNGYYRITAENVSSANDIINSSNNAIRWMLLGRGDLYQFYNPSAGSNPQGRYLDFVKVSNSASLQQTSEDNFTITEQGSSRFYVQSTSRISYPYLGCNSGNNYFNAFNGGVALYFYRQKADFWSYPCSKPVEAMCWGDSTATVESLTLSGTPTSGSAVITSITDGPNDTYIIKHFSRPGRRMRIQWGGNYYRLTVPYIVTPSYTPAVENLPNYDLVILPNARFTVEMNTHLHSVSVYEDASLLIAQGDTLFVDTLYLRSNGPDHHPRVTFGGDEAAIVVNSGVIYHDHRFDDQAYYPLSVPYDANVSRVRYAGLISEEAIPVPAIGTNFWLKTYNGQQRAKDANDGVNMEDKTYWEHIVGNVMKGGAGYSIGLADNTVDNHQERTIRFRMAPNNGARYIIASRDTAIEINPSLVPDPTKKHHSGWNWIGNPYIHTFYPGPVGEDAGLLSGHFEMGPDGKWQHITSENVPYLTFYNAADDDYYQMRADNSSMAPFSTAFIQVEDAEKDMLFYQTPMFADEAPSPVSARRAKSEENRIVKADLLLYDRSTLKSGTLAYDETGLVISNRYTNEYEVGADLVKMSNPRMLHVYTKNATHNLAFNALDEQTAAQPIPVGVSVPKTGSYTFLFDERQYDINALEALYLTDKQQGKTVDLLDEDYSCTIEKGTNEERFVINVILKPEKEDPTNMEAAMVNGLRVLTNTDGSITLYNSSNMTKVQVYDVAGRLLGEWKPNTYQWTVNLPQGVYAVSVQDAQNQITHVKICSK